MTPEELLKTITPVQLAAALTDAHIDLAALTTALTRREELARPLLEAPVMERLVAAATALAPDLVHGPLDLLTAGVLLGMALYHKLTEGDTSCQN